MTKIYNKLVRDCIPEIIEKSGATCKIRILSDEEYIEMIDAKLDEELLEYHTDKSIEELADLLGGVVACSRPLVENNSFDAKHQIGLSGRTVKPKLIICLGISGAVQFAAGMKSSECIVAVNTDKTAPIFNVAHYCVVGDVNEIVPKLINSIKEKA